VQIVHQVANLLLHSKSGSVHTSLVSAFLGLSPFALELVVVVAQSIDPSHVVFAPFGVGFRRRVVASEERPHAWVQTDDRFGFFGRSLVVAPHLQHRRDAQVELSESRELKSHIVGITLCQWLRATQLFGREDRSVELRSLEIPKPMVYDDGLRSVLPTPVFHFELVSFALLHQVHVDAPCSQEVRHRCVANLEGSFFYPRK